MKHRIILTGFLLLVSGCVTAPMEKGLDALMGQDVKTAVDVLGNPKHKSSQSAEAYSDKEQKAVGSTVYYWSLGSRREIVRYKRGSSLSGESATMKMRCSIKLTADASGKLVSWDYTGDKESCSYYIERLNSYLESNNK